MKHAWRAFQFFRPETDRLLVVLLLLFLSIGANLLKPWPLAWIVDSVFADKPLPLGLRGWLDPANKDILLFLLTLALLLLHVGQGGLAAAQNFMSIQVGLNGLRRVRDEVFACLQRLSVRFHQGARSGDLLHRAAYDTYAFQTLFQHGLVTAVTASFSLLFMVVVMWRINRVLTLVSIIVLPVLLLVIKHFARKMQDQSLAAQQADSQVTSFVQQSIVALPLIQSYTREEHEENAFTSRTLAAQEKRLAQHGWEIGYWLAIALIFAVATAGLVWFGSRQVLTGKMTVGELLVFLAYLTQLYEPLNQLSHVGVTVASASGGCQRVFEILDTPEEVRDAPKARPVQGPRPLPAPHPTRSQKRTGHRAATGPPPLTILGNIEFARVSFRYQTNQPILSDLSFSIPAGQSVAILGPSGVGKSTLLNLLPRFFDPDEGAVRFEGVDLRELRLKDLRAQVGLVLQESLLLPATIAENITYGRPRASRKDIEAAAHAAHADKFIERLPNGYASVVGDGGVRLSVGERQRLSLARAFLKDAPILLLDEPTSALDAESEALVVATLARLMEGHTTLIVAHRLSTIAQVDRVLVLQDGQLTEDGSPTELLARGGYYARVAGGQLALD